MPLKFLQPTTWQNIFELWQEREGKQDDWQEVAKQKGWDSWQAWRSNWVNMFEAETRSWNRYLITDPLFEIPSFRVGPTQSWQKGFSPEEQNKHNFKTLVELGTFNQNPKVLEILKEFPTPTEFIGIQMADQSIVLIEGHHRATAVTIASQKKITINFNNPVTIVLTEFKIGEEKILDEMLKRGSVKTTKT